MGYNVHWLNTISLKLGNESHLACTGKSSAIEYHLNLDDAVNNFSEVLGYNLKIVLKPLLFLIIVLLYLSTTIPYVAF